MPNKTIFALSSNVALDKANDIVHLWQPSAPGEKDRKATLQTIIDLLDVNSSFSNVPYLDKSNTFAEDNIFSKNVKVIGILNIDDKWHSFADGSGKYVLKDIINGTSPITVTPNAPTNFLFITTTGIGVLTPVPDMLLSLNGSDASTTVGDGTVGLRIVNTNAGGGGRLTGILMGGRGQTNKPFATIQAVLVSDAASEQTGHMAFATKSVTTATDPIERMRITDVGKILIHLTSAITGNGSAAKLQVAGGIISFRDIADGDVSIWLASDSQILWDESEDTIAIPKIYDKTSGSAANVFIDSNGLLYRSTA